VRKGLNLNVTVCITSMFYVVNERKLADAN